ncbi:MAG: beta-galactosidase [Muribaculum sp.]|nr:beta-galactosidase [Muribaculum sp.]
MTPSETVHRSEICLNGFWDLQIMLLPADWKYGEGVAPELPSAKPDAWESVKIKIPSPINVNDWGKGLHTGEGTPNPYVPSSVYYPSYPDHWADARMAWLRKEFCTPEFMDGRRAILHFEAVAGDAKVMVNGKEATTHFGLHLPFETDITELLNTDGSPNELLVGVRDTKLFDRRHPDFPMMAATYPTGSNTDYLIGIWQDVYLHTVPEVSVSDVYVKPLVDSDSLVIVATVDNKSDKAYTVALSADIHPWINHSDFNDVLSGPVPSWELGEAVLNIPLSTANIVAPKSTREITICVSPSGNLDYWTPETPTLYTALVRLSDNNGEIDLKAIRFGWRQLKLDGRDFKLNGKKIQCFGDIQHPFSAYITSRRFAYAWYRMIKDFGGNAVRPHAQPWPRVYYDLADEMGLMVLDETGLFGSSIRLNFEDDELWSRSADHLRDLIMRDRNHPSVIGWSVGNETFAIALLNKPPETMARAWNDSLASLASKVPLWDDTRSFITFDGDRDLDGRMPVWSRHLSHGLELQQIPTDNPRPLIVGESGATYYGRPEQLYQFVGEDSYRDYRGRSRALAIDVYQNVRQMALPMLAYYSPSEVCWFGLEHLPLGYSDFSRLPDDADGIFAGRPYEEGKPGYQYERIPPYVTTFNPGLDSELPIYRPLPMFNALKAALNGDEWEGFTPVSHPDTVPAPTPMYDNVWIGEEHSAELDSLFLRLGIPIVDKPSRRSLIVLDASTASASDVKRAFSDKRTRMLAFVTSDDISEHLSDRLPGILSVLPRKATSMKTDSMSAWSRFFELPDLYFAESGPDGCDRHVVKRILSGSLLDGSDIVFRPADTDWSLFNNVAEHWKCAQICLYEALQKQDGAALLTIRLPRGTSIALTTIDPGIRHDESLRFWRRTLALIGLETQDSAKGVSNVERKHDLLLNGPMD